MTQRDLQGGAVSLPTGVDRNDDGAAPRPGDEREDRARVAVDDFPLDPRPSRDRLMPLLCLVDEIAGCVPESIQERIAGRLGLSTVQVQSVVSFYPAFRSSPPGRFRLQICAGTMCGASPATWLLDAVTEITGLGMGEVSDDGAFSLELRPCLGACAVAPALGVNGRLHGRMTPGLVRGLLRELRARDRGDRPRGRNA
ncbi:MAG: NAD(P)H-dependent oxidoreductase subunit E [Acidobacteriota bacterium]